MSDNVDSHTGQPIATGIIEYGCGHVAPADPVRADWCPVCDQTDESR